MRTLLELRANPAARTVNGWAVLEGVMMLESSEQVKLIAQLLIKHGAVETLHSLAAFGDLRNAKIIVSAAQINELVHGIAPIHVAVKANKLDNVEWLCENGAQIELQDIENRSPLRIACEYGAVNMALFFVSKGASIDKAGSIDVARQRGHFILAVTLEREKNRQEIKALQSRLERLQEKKDFLQGKQVEIHQEVGKIGNIGLLDFAKRSTRDNLQEQSRRHSVEESRVTSQIDDIARKIRVLQEEERKLSKQLDILIKERPGELRGEAEELQREAAELEERALKLRKDAENKIEEATRFEREQNAQRRDEDAGGSKVEASAEFDKRGARDGIQYSSGLKAAANSSADISRNNSPNRSSLQFGIPSTTVTATTVSPVSRSSFVSNSSLSNGSSQSVVLGATVTNIVISHSPSVSSSSAALAKSGKSGHNMS